MKVDDRKSDEGALVLSMKLLSFVSLFLPAGIVTRLAFKFINKNLNELHLAQNERKFRICRYVLVKALLRLSPSKFKNYFYNGSGLSNSIIQIAKPQFKCLATNSLENNVRELVKTKLSQNFDPRIFLVSVLYDQPYDVDPDLNFFQQALECRELTPIYISYLFSTSQMYVEIGEPERHLAFSEKALDKFIGFIDKADAQEKVRLCQYLKYYMEGSLSLLASSDHLKYQKSKIQLLAKYLQVMEPELIAAGAQPLLDSPKSKKRIGVIRFTLDINGESELVFAAIQDPPEDTDVFVFAFDLAPQAQKNMEALPGFKGKVVSLSSANLIESLFTLRSYQLDILINTSPLSGRFLNEISILLLLRSAKKQLMFISDIVSSGIPSVDYFLLPKAYSGDKFKSHFSESVLTIPGLCAANFLHKDIDVSAIEPSRKRIRFGTNAHVMKLSPQVIQAWAQILKNVEGSQVVLMPFKSDYSKVYLNGLQKSISNACATTGIDSERFLILNASGLKEVRQNLSTCDIYLDSFPYSGSISILDVLCTEKPMVTLRGEFYRSRMAAGILDELDLQNDMIAETVERYIILATKQASDRSLRKELGQKITSHMASRSDIFNANATSSDFYKTISEVIAR